MREYSYQKITRDIESPHKIIMIPNGKIHENLEEEDFIALSNLEAILNNHNPVGVENLGPQGTESMRQIINLSKFLAVADVDRKRSPEGFGAKDLITYLVSYSIGGVATYTFYGLAEKAARLLPLYPDAMNRALARPGSMGLNTLINGFYFGKTVKEFLFPRDYKSVKEAVDWLKNPDNSTRAKILGALDYGAVLLLSAGSSIAFLIISLENNGDSNLNKGLSSVSFTSYTALHWSGGKDLRYEIIPWTLTPFIKIHQWRKKRQDKDRFNLKQMAATLKSGMIQSLTSAKDNIAEKTQVDPDNEVLKNTYAKMKNETGIKTKELLNTFELLKDICQEFSTAPSPQSTLAKVAKRFNQAFFIAGMGTSLIGYTWTTIKEIRDLGTSIEKAIKAPLVRKVAFNEPMKYVYGSIASTPLLALCVQSSISTANKINGGISHFINGFSINHMKETWQNLSLANIHSGMSAGIQQLKTSYETRESLYLWYKTNWDILKKNGVARVQKYMQLALHAQNNPVKMFLLTAFVWWLSYWSTQPSLDLNHDALITEAHSKIAYDSTMPFTIVFTMLFNSSPIGAVLKDLWEKIQIWLKNSTDKRLFNQLLEKVRTKLEETEDLDTEQAITQLLYSSEFEEIINKLTKELNFSDAEINSIFPEAERNKIQRDFNRRNLILNEIHLEKFLENQIDMISSYDDFRFLESLEMIANMNGGEEILELWFTSQGDTDTTAKKSVADILGADVCALYHIDSFSAAVKFIVNKHKEIEAKDEAAKQKKTAGVEKRFQSEMWKTPDGSKRPINETTPLSESTPVVYSSI